MRVDVVDLVRRDPRVGERHGDGGGRGLPGRVGLGEVVVIDENFGIRVTSIDAPPEDS